MIRKLLVALFVVVVWPVSGAVSVGAAEVDPVTAQIRKLEMLGAESCPAPLWRHKDAALQAGLDGAINDLGLSPEISKKRLSVVLVDVTDEDDIRVAERNGDQMMYAASLPKIAIMLAVFEKIRAGELKLTQQLEHELELMIRYSSNTAATGLIRKVGKDYIASVMMAPRYRLYDPSRNGGLWVGKDYASSGLWRRDPLHNLSHGATAMQVARFYYLLETGRLVTPELSRKMKAIMAETKVRSKFAKGLAESVPSARMYRKSGTWRTYHSDSAIIEHDGRRYIAAALSNSAKGAEWLSRLIVSMDSVVFATAKADRSQRREQIPLPSPASRYRYLRRYEKAE
jgi:beta-lactamase class A